MPQAKPTLEDISIPEPTDLDDLNSALEEASVELRKVQAERQKLQDELKTTKEINITLELVSEMQAKKINELISECEEMGAELKSLEALERRLLYISTNSQAALSELFAWRHLGMTQLGPSIEGAQHQLAIFWGYVKAMETPGHRFVSFIGRGLSKNFLGRKLKDLLYALYALKESR